jgi:hypothetical protein
MSGTATADKAKSVEFGSDQFLANAKVYAEHKRIVDAASRYDNVDDAVAAIKTAWAALEGQIEDGSGYTPDASLGFGSDNATVIAESILGRRPTVGAIRKAFAGMGK